MFAVSTRNGTIARRMLPCIDINDTKVCSRVNAKFDTDPVKPSV